MKTFIAFFCASLVASSATADIYSMAKQQAQNAAASEQRNQQAIGSSGQIAPAPAPPPGNPSPQPNPALEATLQNIANLRADFENFAAGQTNSRPLADDLMAAAQGAKASAASVTQLAGHLAAIAGNKKLQPQHQKLAQDIHAIFNSSHLSAAQREMVCDSVQKILLEGGTPSEDVTNVVGDLNTIAAETK